MVGGRRSKISKPGMIHRLREIENVLGGCAAAVEHDDRSDGLFQRRTYAVNWLATMGITTLLAAAHGVALALRSSILGSRCSSDLRLGSSHSGILSSSPSVSIGSSKAKPGGSVANSNKTPPGSRK